MKNRKAEYLTSIRNRKGLSRYQVAKDTKIAYKSISRWENGEVEPTMENFFKLTDYYGIDRTKAEEVYTGLVFGDKFLDILLSNEDVKDLGEWEEMTPDELAEAAFAKGHMQILEYLIEKGFVRARKFVQKHFEPSFWTESDAGSLTVNGVMLPNGYGDCTNAVYIATDENRIPTPAGMLIATVQDKADFWNHDCKTEEGVTTIEGDLIHIYRIAPAVFVIKTAKRW